MKQPRRVISVQFADLPNEGFVSAQDICRRRGAPGIVPWGVTSWKGLVKAGKAPAPEYPFGAHMPLWRVAEIRLYLREPSKWHQGPSGRINTALLETSQAIPIWP
jgi:hypothetical protein